MKTEKSKQQLKAGVYQELPTDWEYFWEDGKQKVIRMRENGKPHIDFVDVWECRKCRNSFQQKGRPKAICKECNACKSYNKVTPPGLKEPWIRYDRPILSDKTDSILKDITRIMEDYGVIPKSIEYRICAYWCIGTYFYRQFQAFPRLPFSGVINSGKSRMLRLLRWFSYRAILHASCSPSVLVREIDEFHPAILIDEIDSKLNRKWESGGLMFDILDESYKSDSNYSRCKQGKDKGIVYDDVYCPMAFAGRKIIDPALSSRAINIAMVQAVPKIKDLPKELSDEIQEIRSKLLGMKLKGVELPEVNPDLDGRTREIFTPIIAVAEYFGEDYSDIIEYAKELEKVRKQEMSTGLDADILEIIAKPDETIGKEYDVRLKRIADLLDVTPQKIGYAVRSMGIIPVRDNKSTVVRKGDLDTLNVLIELWKRYSIDVDKTVLATWIKHAEMVKEKQDKTEQSKITE